MYAIIQTGGKQYKVTKGDIMEIELIDNQSQVTFKDVLLVVDGDKVSVGTPHVKGASVLAKVVGTGKDNKVTTFKYKRKTNYHRTIGHRQPYTRIQVEEIKHGA
ncbi:MAG: 50S ribosomal protein L21 [Candidatus Margulisbacteria bacterium]|nr:50S ribosomal protein L21 [Candidatus Margulisiibacteriota bacterium]MBU1617200.1 50S ribosomal protein L21 [Candidatus Margulisiibacteriota bacterium]